MCAGRTTPSFFLTLLRENANALFEPGELETEVLMFTVTKYDVPGLTSVCHYRNGYALYRIGYKCTGGMTKI